MQRQGEALLGAQPEARESSPGSTTGPGAFEFPVPSPLPIHKGDYIGIKSDGVHGMRGIDNPDANGLTFDPAVEFPNARKPSFSSHSEYQFNMGNRLGALR